MFTDFVSTVVIVSFDSFNQLTKILFVFSFNISESNGSAHFSTYQLSETGSTFDDAVWDFHFAAKSWKVNNDFNWVDIMSNNDELCLLTFYKVNDLVDTGCKLCRTSRWSIGFTFSAIFSALYEFSFFLSFALWCVLSGEFKQLSSGLFVQSLSELIDGWGNLQTLLENSALTLEFDVFWPTNKTRKITFWLNVLTNTEIFGTFLKKRIFTRLLFWWTRLIGAVATRFPLRTIFLQFFF